MSEPGPDGVRSKLIATKQQWARDGRGLSEEPASPDRPRLPPGQHEVGNWPVLDLGIQPKVDTNTWELTVDGRVAQPLRWTWSDFLAQPQVDRVSDIHCVTTWSRFDNRWQGVSARHLLARVQPLPEARYLLCHGSDGYTTNLPLSAFDDDDVLLAHRWQDEAIAPEHGGPVRVVVPKLYFWKSAKWLCRIELLAEDRPGFWETRGYHSHGDPWTEQRYG